MKKLAPFLAPYKKESVLGPLFKLLEASFELLVPLVMASIIDRGIGSGDRGHIARMCVLLVALGAVGLVCSLTAQYFAAKAAVGFSARLRHALFAKIQSLSFGALDRIGATTLITRLTSDINLVQNGLNMVLRLFLRSPFIVLGAMVMAFTVDWQAALVFVVTIPVLSVVVFAIMLVSIPLYRKVQQRLDRLLGLTRETLTGARVLRAFGKEEDETADFREKNGALVAVQQFVGRISGLMNPLTYVVINAATLALLWTGAIRVDGGFITQGAVVALVNYMSQILVELVKLANLIITVTKSVACAGRLEAVLELLPGSAAGRRPAGPGGTGRLLRALLAALRRDGRPRPLRHPLLRRSGRDDRSHRRHRLGQELCCEPHPPLLRPDGGLGAALGRGCARLPARAAAPEGRTRPAKGGALSGDGPRESAMGQGGRLRRGTPGGSARRPGA